MPVYNSNGTVQYTSTATAPAPTTPNAGTPAPAPAKSTAPAQTPTPTATVNSSARQDKINKINSLLSTKEKFVNGGFSVVIDTMKSVSGGKTNISDFSDAELDAMIEACEK